MEIRDFPYTKYYFLQAICSSLIKKNKIHFCCHSLYLTLYIYNTLYLRASFLGIYNAVFTYNTFLAYCE